MTLVKRGNTSLMVYRKPELVNRDAVNKYVELYGTPFCRCCGDITFDCLFRIKDGKWTLYCINCGLTRDMIGTCVHHEKVKVVIVERKVYEQETRRRE